MKKRKIKLFSESFKNRLQKLKLINDSPQRIAVGFGIGVFLGIMPGFGIIAALIAAAILKVNRVSIILGTLLTNTWLSLLILILSIKVGSGIIGVDWKDVYNQWSLLIKDFSWKKITSLSLHNVVYPVIVGYIVISIFLGILAYLFALIIIKRMRYAKNKN